MKDPEEISLYRRRRERLARAIGEGVALVPTAPERTRNRDSHFPYRFDSYFYYLTGFTEPEAALVIVGGEAPRTLLFCRTRNEEREIWDGFRHGPEGLRQFCRIETVIENRKGFSWLVPLVTQELWFPYKARTLHVLRKFMKTFY